MVKIRLFIFSLFLLSPFSNNSCAQSKVPSKEEIKKTANLASKYLYYKNFEKSLAAARQSLHYATIIKDDYLIAVSYNLIASNFNALAEVDKSIFYYKKGLTYANKTNNDIIKDYINNNLGNVYCFEKKQHKKGISYYKKSLEYSQKTADISQIVCTKLNIAWACFAIGRFKDGHPYLEFSNKYHSKFGYKSTIVTLNMLNGMHYANIGQNTKAETYFLEAIKLGNIEVGLFTSRVLQVFIKKWRL